MVNIKSKADAAFIFAALKAQYRLSLILFIVLILFTSPIANAADLAKMSVIRRDEYGVPHIVADTEEAAAFAQGYATAEDHFAELSRLFLRARGEQAAVFGEKYAAEDILVHKLGIWETAKSRFTDLPPSMQLILNAYTGGYNLYRAGHKDGGKVPEWAGPITGIDVLAHARAVLLLDFVLDLKPWKAPVDRIPGFGSTMWAVGKGRSQSGHGMLLANPHLRWEGAQLFHEIQLTVPGRINVTGATLIGFPVVLIGFNDYMGWSLTVNEHHADSVYELELNPQNPNEYLYDGGMLPLRSTSFSIDVKTDSGIVKRTETELWSHYGPIIRIQGNKAYAYNSPNLANVNFLSEFNLMAKARSFTEFRGALGMQEIPMFNLAYTDRDGNVFYLYNGRFPVRPKGHDWSKPVSGSDSSTEWYTILPIAELPQLYDPPSGFIQNCNDAPWYVTTGESIDHTQYPAYEGDSEVGWRGQASIRILESAPAITLEEIKKDKYSEHLLLAERLKPELVELARQSQNTSPEMQEAVKVLEKWQDRATAQSEGAMLFVKWWDEYRRSTHKLFQVDWAADQPFSTPRGIGDPKAAMTALISAITWSKTTYGKLDVPWGEVHRLRRGNLDVAVGGLSAMGSLRSIAFREGPANRWTGIGGDSYVLAVEFTDPPTAFSVLEYSESSDTQSKHFNDQLKLFAEEGYKQLWTREKDIKAHTERAYHPGE